MFPKAQNIRAEESDNPYTAPDQRILCQKVESNRVISKVISNPLRKDPLWATKTLEYYQVSMSIKAWIPLFPEETSDLKKPPKSFQLQSEYLNFIKI